jgi:transposase InsO family protein
MPSHALTEAERARIIEVVNQPRFAETPPARIVAILADQGVYIASEASFYRVLRAAGQMHRRGRARSPRPTRPPTTHIATRPGDVWCWDVTFLPALVQGQWFYLYLILDLYSRKIVGFEVHPTDSADHAAHLAKRTALSEGLHGMAVKPVLHGDIVGRGNARVAYPRDDRSRIDTAIRGGAPNRNASDHRSRLLCIEMVLCTQFRRQRGNMKAKITRLSIAPNGSPHQSLSITSSW